MNRPVGYSTKNRERLLAEIETKLSEADSSDVFLRLKERMSARTSGALEMQSIEDTVEVGSHRSIARAAHARLDVGPYRSGSTLH